MKKFIKGLSLALILAFSCVLLTACGGPKNLAKAEEIMKEADYNVVVTLAEEGNEDGKVGTISATKIDIGLGSGLNVNGEHITATLFESSKAAKAYYEGHKDEEKEDEDQVLKVKGKWVYFGTETAIEIFLG